MISTFYDVCGGDVLLRGLVDLREIVLNLSGLWPAAKPQKATNPHHQPERKVACRKSAVILTCEGR